jgi:hypothetical protein
VLRPCCMEQLVGVCNPLISLKPLREGLQHENPQKNEGKTARNPYLMGGSSGDPSRIRTCNPRSRNPLLYPVELWDHRGLHSTANMKNPLSRQAGCEPFCPLSRQIPGGGPVLRSRPTQCCAAADRGAARLVPAMSHATFPPPGSIAMSPSPFSAVLFVTRRSSAQGAPS